MTNPFKLVSSKEIYKNPWIEVHEDVVIRPGGKEGIFGIVNMIPGSTILPITDDGYTYLTKEYKYAIGSISTEVISGAIDHGETALEAAKRELREEAGFDATKWTNLSVVNPFTTVIACPNYIFMAEELTQVERSLDEGEEIKLEKVLFTDVVQMVLDGTITHGASCVAILKVALLRKWGQPTFSGYNRQRPRNFRFWAG